MATEIEYKFLVDPAVIDTLPPPTLTQHIQQGYLSTDPEKTIRIRLTEYEINGRIKQDAYVTIKGRSVGPARKEFEYAIPYEDGIELIEMCGSKSIEKTRRHHPFGELMIELDIFAGANEGLVIAEIEVASIATEFVPPKWFGKNVTEDHRYANSSLLLNPIQHSK